MESKYIREVHINTDSVMQALKYRLRERLMELHIEPLHHPCIPAFEKKLDLKQSQSEDISHLYNKGATGIHGRTTFLYNQVIALYARHLRSFLNDLNVTK